LKAKFDQLMGMVTALGKLDQEKEETENKMMQETNPVESTQHLFNQMIQPSQKELSISESIEMKSSQEDSSQENVLQSESTLDANCQMGSMKLLPYTQSYMSAKVGAACVKSEVTDELIGPKSNSIKVRD
jgi:hypothetical protein